MLLRLKQLPLHLLLLPAFFVLHIVNEYYGLLDMSLAGRYTFYYLLLSVVLFFAGKLFYKSNQKAGLWAMALLIFFFFWGAFHDYVKNLFPSSFFSSYSFLLSLSIILISLLSVKLKTNEPPVRATIFFNFLFCILVILELVEIGGNAITGANGLNNLSRKNPQQEIIVNKADSSRYPDIYFIVFDEYTSTKALKKYFNFDNSSLDSAMRNYNFYIAGNSKSNYNSTPMSVTSTFNMQYFNLEAEELIFGSKEIQQAWYSLSRNFLHRFLKKIGYRVLDYSLGADGTMTPAKFTRRNHIKILSGETFWKRFQHDIMWNFLLFWPSSRDNNNSETYDDNNNALNFKRTLAELKSQSDSPRLVYTHLLFPHPPFDLDRNGQRINPLQKDTPISDSQGYLEQVRYANKLIQQIAQAANQTRARPSVVIIEGDHGYRYKAPEVETTELQYMNLSMFYFSDNDYRLLYDSISPVNSFRVILNKYFNTKLPLLKDSVVKIHYLPAN